jgi:hypothetical protein
MKSSNMLPLSSEADLKAVFKITDKDLDDNHHGRLSPAQIRQIRGWQGLWSVVVWGGVAGLAWVVTHGSASTDLVRAFVIVMSVFILSLFWLQAAARRAVFIGTVKMLQGRIIKDRLSTAYTISLSDHTFVVEAQVYEAFVNEAAYTLYYVPQIQYLVAAEPTMVSRIL